MSNQSLPLPEYALAQQLIDQMKRDDTSDDTVVLMTMRVGDRRASGVMTALIERHSQDLADPKISDTHRMALWRVLFGLGRMDLVEPLLDAMISSDEHACNIVEHDTLVDPVTRKAVLRHAMKKGWTQKFMPVRTHLCAKKSLSEADVVWREALSDFLTADPSRANPSAASSLIKEYLRIRAMLPQQENVEAMDSRIRLTLGVYQNHGLDMEGLIRGSYIIREPEKPTTSGAAHGMALTGEKKKTVNRQHQGMLHNALFQAVRVPDPATWLPAVDMLVELGSDWRGLIEKKILTADEEVFLKRVPSICRELLNDIVPTRENTTPKRGMM